MYTQVEFNILKKSNILSGSLGKFSNVDLEQGGINKARRQWKKKKEKYLFNQDAMGKVFRTRFLTALKEAWFSIPKNG